jgi:hypothetical protein
MLLQRQAAEEHSGGAAGGTSRFLWHVDHLATTDGDDALELSTDAKNFDRLFAGTVGAMRQFGTCPNQTLVLNSCNRLQKR